jgi:tetratricopeptide (TPR) repeat protein
MTRKTVEAGLPKGRDGRYGGERLLFLKHRFLSPLLRMTRRCGYPAGGLVLLASFVFAQNNLNALLKEAEAAWQRRDQPGQTEAAIDLWKKALEADPQKTELNIRLAKAAGRAYRKSSEKKTRQQWADEAKRFGAAAVQAGPENPEALSAYAESLGQWSQANKGVGSLKEVRKAVEVLEKAVSIDPKHCFSHMLLANFYDKAPRMLSVGDKKKALEHAERAVECDPDTSIYHVTLAEVYLARGRKADAKVELEKTLALPLSKEWAPETRSDQAKARELLKEL